MQKIKIYLILLSVLLGLSFLALVWLTNAFSPEKTGTLILFYVFVALCSFSVSTLIGFYIRKFFGQREFLNSYVATASRQGIWLSLILVVSLLLLSQGWFTWINAIFLILAFVFFESYLLAKNELKN